MPNRRPRGRRDSTGPRRAPSRPRRSAQTRTARSATCPIAPRLPHVRRASRWIRTGSSCRQGTTTTGLVAWWADLVADRAEDGVGQLAVATGSDDDERGERARLDEGGAGPVGDGAALDRCDEAAGVDLVELLCRKRSAPAASSAGSGTAGRSRRRVGQVPGVHGDQRRGSCRRAWSTAHCSARRDGPDPSTPTTTGRAVAVGVVADDGDGARGAVEHLAAHRAEQQPAEAAHAAGPDDEQVTRRAGRSSRARAGRSHTARRATATSRHRQRGRRGRRAPWRRSLARVVRVERHVRLEVVLVDVAPRHDRGDGLVG